MPLLSFKSQDINTSYAVWGVTESEQDLKSRLELTKIQRRKFSKIKSESNRKSWLASRISAVTLLKHHQYDFKSLDEDFEGNFFLKNGVQIYMSMSWVGEYVVCCLDKERPIGVEIDCPGEKFYKKRHSYLGDNDYYIDTKDREKLCFYYLSKKAAIKAYSVKNCFLKYNIQIDSSPMGLHDTINGYVYNEPFTSKCYRMGSFHMVICRRLIKWFFSH